MLYVLIIVVIMWMNTFVKMYPTVHLKLMHLFMYTAFKDNYYHV